MRRVMVNDRGQRIGADHPNCRIPDWAIALILELRDAGMSLGKIAAKFDDPAGDGFTVSKSQVFKVCAGLVRAQVPARVKTVRD
jgi:hypothetical protein